ncbi:glycosyltransferase family 4 protein [[Clostridium] innocuum]|nr:glycosyltransferase family 4 protein [[Clostridium] innocuum]
MRSKGKVLFIAHLDSHIQAFHIPYLKMFKENGYEVYVASCGDRIFEYCDKKYNLPFARNPMHFNNFQALKKLKKIMDENSFEIVHCHTPVGGVVARIANRISKNYQNSRMIYTAHGFHFFSGAPIINWVLYYPIERLCARFTDTLITINKEDYTRAMQFKLKKGGSIHYVPGVGMNLDKINQISGDRAELIDSLHIPKKSTLLLSVGELNKNKNHETVIKALPLLPDSIHYLICGQGDLKMNLTDLAKKLGVSNRVHMLGFRNDVIQIMKSCDVFVFPSKREGLSVALMEAKASGLLCIVSNVRGNKDLITDNIDGFVLDLNDFQEKIIAVLENEKGVFKSLIEAGLENVKKYSLDEVSIQMKNIYELEV